VSQKEEIRYLLEQYDININEVRERYPGKEISPEILRAYITQKFFPKIKEKRRVIGVRKVIASRLSTSYREAVHVTLHMEAGVDKLLELRSRIKDLFQKDVSLTLLLIKLTAKALEEHKELNATYEKEEIIIYEDVNVSFAVDTPYGLVSPVLRRVNGKNLLELQDEYVDLVRRAQAGKLKEKDLVGGTFTVTNLGMYDVLFFNPIINPPQVAILGLGKITEKFYLEEHTNSLQRKRFIILSLSFDHRVIDGAPAARFLQKVKSYIENPEIVLNLT